MVAQNCGVFQLLIAGNVKPEVVGYAYCLDSVPMFQFKQTLAWNHSECQMAAIWVGYMWTKGHKWATKEAACHLIYGLKRKASVMLRDAVENEW